MQTKVPPPDESKAQPPVDAPAVLQSKDLLGTRQTIDIEHNGQRYRLQTTKAGKLILTK
ncbi:MAG: hemin uptake protein HemP [Pseudomonadota bacterium]|jgi:hemin uptake protein HemP